MLSELMWSVVWGNDQRWPEAVFVSVSSFWWKLIFDISFRSRDMSHRTYPIFGLFGPKSPEPICSAYYVSVICRLPIATFSLTSKSLLRVMIRYNTPTFCSPLWKRYPSENLKIDILSLTQFFESSWQKSRRMELNPRWKIYLISPSTYWF